ncbi:MAG: ABC transporter ATP-binding protein, partial [Calditrichia bacterium]|nr:ABC transporter ATP-binding protein [Calditrichia bacterium]
GCGKTTAMRMVAGLEEVTTGEIFIDDREITELPPRNRNVSMIFQNYAVWPHMTVYENIAYALKLKKMKKDDIDRTVDEVAAIVKIGELLERYPSQLSGGQQQRVSLMRALTLDPPILLLDEPLGALDPMIRYELQEDLKHIFSSLHKTVLMVTHDLAEAAYFADHIVLMNQGSIVQQGQISDLFQRPADTFVTKFIQAQRAIHNSEGTVSE